MRESTGAPELKFPQNNS